MNNYMSQLIRWGKESGVIWIAMSLHIDWNNEFW